MHHLGEQALQIGDFVVAVNDAITNALKRRHEREQKQRDAKKAAKKEEEKKKEQALQEWGVQQPSPSPSKREAKKRRRSRRRGFSPQVSGNPRADVEPRSIPYSVGDGDVDENDEPRRRSSLTRLDLSSDDE